MFYTFIDHVFTLTFFLIFVFHRAGWSTFWPPSSWSSTWACAWTRPSVADTSGGESCDRLRTMCDGNQTGWDVLQNPCTEIWDSLESFWISHLWSASCVIYFFCVLNVVFLDKYLDTLTFHNDSLSTCCWLPEMETNLLYRVREVCREGCVSTAVVSRGLLIWWWCFIFI